MRSDDSGTTDDEFVGLDHRTVEYDRSNQYEII